MLANSIQSYFHRLATRLSQGVDPVDSKTIYQLILFRGIAIIMLLLLLFIADLFLKLVLPYSSIFIFLGLYLIIHLWLWYQYRHAHRVFTQFYVFLHLSLDSIIFTYLLTLSGGISNPFIGLLIIPLIISATILNTMFTQKILILTMISYTALGWYYLPVFGFNSADYNVNNILYYLGLWFSFIISAVLIAYFITSMRNILHRKEQQLHHIKAQSIKDKQLITIASLSASTAHELGTPLATINLLCSELEAEITDESIRNELLSPLKQQVKRCKDILSVLSSASGNIHLKQGKKIPIDQFINNLLTDWLTKNNYKQLSNHYANHSPVPEILAEQILEQAIINILDNAKRVSKNGFKTCLEWNNKSINFNIHDSGPGMDKNQMDKLGKQPLEKNSDGMGLGLFLSHTIIERMGGTVHYQNHSQGGLLTTITLPILHSYE